MCCNIFDKMINVLLTTLNNANKYSRTNKIGPAIAWSQSKNVNLFGSKSLIIAFIVVKYIVNDVKKDILETLFIVLEWEGSNEPNRITEKKDIASNNIRNNFLEWLNLDFCGIYTA